MGKNHLQMNLPTWLLPEVSVFTDTVNLTGLQGNYDKMPGFNPFNVPAWLTWFAKISDPYPVL